MHTALRSLAFFLIAFVALPAAAQFKLFGQGDALLEPEKAFQFAARAIDARTLEVNFTIADGYYMYRDKFRFALEGTDGVVLGVPQLPPGIRKKDEFFGEVETYRKSVSVQLPLERANPAAQSIKLNVTSQGCADIGVCYTPMDSSATLQLAALSASDGGGGAGGAPVLSEAPRAIEPSASFSIFASDLDIAKLFEGNLVIVLLSFLGFGLLLAFTPCVLPMVPILSGIIAGEGRGLNKARAFILSLAYVLGMAVTYAAAGVAAAYSGTLLAAALQNAWVLGSFALVFVWLALSMFGFYDLQLPGFLHHRLHSAHRRLEGGKIASVAAMGMFSAIIVSPCVAAPLAGALLYISQTKDVALGGAALFAMALGMGIPLIAVGVSEGALLPKSGAWMEGVKKFFGVLLLGVAIWIVSPIVPVAVQMLAWAALLVGGAMFLRAIDPLPATASGWARLWKGVGMLALVAGIAMLVGVLAGARDPLKPLGGVMGGAQTVAAPVNWVRVNSVPELEQRLQSAGRPVMLDFYADWCVSCKEMERFTFSDPGVRAVMDKMLLLQADVTENTAQHKLLLKRFSLFGPPGIIFFDAKGREIKGLRVVGYQDSDRFLKTLAQANPR
ncbi:MAG: thiol:disulfide interchange protein [Betaproteobacteria bacterium SG8_39]|nr:MAG: thiol:disulfide interchange protein [Betaproteobacteria bacterium SG8_39]